MPLAHIVGVEYPIESVKVRAYRVPTEQQPQESDGTLTWSATTLVLAQVAAGGLTGLGFSYADCAAATIIQDVLQPVLVGRDAMQIGARYAQMRASVRNDGRGGITAMAISALDIALWDLKGKLLQAPTFVVLGAARSAVPVYGSGGFTSYGVNQLTTQLQQWVHGMRIPRVKMKVGRDPEQDPARVAHARSAIGENAELFVDANGAYVPKQALRLAQAFAQSGVSWYEEPVYHNDLNANRFVRERAPAAMEISNGEYGYCPQDFARIIEAGAADVLQADVTRCGGFSGFLAADALCEAYNLPLSSHCAPYATLHVAIAAKMLRHIEYFHDHVRIERRFFDGVSEPQAGMLSPDPQRPGLGLDFKETDAREFSI